MVRIERIARDNARFIEIETAIAIVQTEQRQDVEQVNSSPSTYFPPTRICAALRCDREGIPAANKLVNLLFNRRVRRQTHGNGVILPGTDGVHRHARIGKAANIIEPQRRRTVADTPGGIGRRRQIRLGVNLFTDFQQLPWSSSACRKLQIIKSHILLL
jgi:hypothetical protein